MTTTTRARCSRVETVEERRWWYSASRAGFWRVLGRVSLLSMSAPAVGSPEPREEITQLKVVLPRLKDLFCSVAKNAVAKNAHSDSANSLGLLFPDFNSANSLGLLFPDSDSANSLGRNSRRIRIQEPIKTAPDEPEENDVSKNVELNCWIPCWASPFSEPCATARARWTPPKARSTRPTRPTSRSRPHRAVPTSQRHGYQAEDVRLHSLDSNRASGFNSWPLGLTSPGFNYPPRSSAGSSGPRPGLSDSLESASSSRCHVSPPSVPRSRLPRSTRSVRSRAVRPER